MQHIKFLKATLFCVFLDVIVAFHVPLFYTRLKHRVARLMMGVSFSKQKGSEEPRSEEPRSRSNSLISLQNVREPGANEDQSLLQQKLISGYDSTAVAIPRQRNTQVAKNPQAENYFLFNEAVWEGVFSFCSTTDLLQIRLVWRFFKKIIQDYNIQHYNQDDHVLFLSHMISMLSDKHSFFSKRYILTDSPITIIPQVRYNPFYDIENLPTLLKNLLYNNISNENAIRLNSILLKMEKDIQTPVEGIGICKRWLLFLSPWTWFGLSALMIFLTYCFAGVVEVPAMLQILIEQDGSTGTFTQLPCSFMFKNQVVNFYFNGIDDDTFYYYNHPVYHFNNFTQFMLEDLPGNYTLLVRNACETAHFHFIENWNNIISIHTNTVTVGDIVSMIVYNPFTSFHRVIKSDHFQYSFVSAIQFLTICGFLLSLIFSIGSLIGGALLLHHPTLFLKGESKINKLAQLYNHVKFFKNKLNPPTEEATERTDFIVPAPIPT